MKRQCKYALTFPLVMAETVSCVQSHVPDSRPDIIVILSDDTGYSDLNFMGGEARTPNLDALAAGGLVFTNCYNNAKSSPTRASLMTGLYNQRTYTFGKPGRIDTTGCICMAELLRKSGYATICSGKWHMFPKATEVGFERHYGMQILPTYYKPLDDHIMIDEEGVDVPIPDSFYSVRDYTDYAIRCIDQEMEGKNRPFFLYLAYHNVHWPLQARPETIARYEGIYDGGTDRVRRERYCRMTANGIMDSTCCRLSDWNRNVRSWDQLSPEERREVTDRMEVHTASLDEMDEQIGRLVNHLRKIGRYENTVIFFMQDNGVCGAGGELGEEFQPLDPGIKIQGKIGERASYYKLGKHGASTFSAPLRLYKSHLYNGGIQTPLLVHWPRVIRNKRKSSQIQYNVNRTPVFVTDVAPTCYDIAGIRFPKEFKGKELISPDGSSIMDTFADNSSKSTQDHFWKFGNQCAAISCGFKAIGFYDGQNKCVKRWELYDLMKDVSETTDLSEVCPEILEELVRKWEDWSRSVPADTK